MPVTREIWSKLFEPSNAPIFPCPICSSGRLRLDEDTLEKREPTYSELLARTDEWEPDWTRYRFSALFQCDANDCGEVSACMGDAEYVEINDEEFGWTYQQFLRLQGMFPAPPMFPIPSSVPSEVKSEIKKAFALYWTDLGACAARLRASLERLLDERGIPKEAKTKKGKLAELDLNGRIDAFKKAAGDDENAKSMHALRMVGNLGAHGADVSREVLFDVLDVYEDALLEIYEQKSVKLAALKAKILGSKGKY